MVEFGEETWGSAWPGMYRALGGNPWAAMPSLHFATALTMAAALAEAGPVEGAAGWGYALSLGFALVYLGEHYLTDLLAGALLVAAVRRGEPLAAPLVQRVNGALRRISASPAGSVPGVYSGGLGERRGGRGAAAVHAAAAAADGGRRPCPADRDLLLFPKLVGLGDALSKLDEAEPVWIGVAIGFNVVAFATYVALFKAVVGGKALRLTWAETYEINLAGLAATLLFSAAGAGGIALTYWALRKAGMGRRDAGRRMVAFLTLHYAFYPLALVAFGVLLRTGVLDGRHPVELTVIPASIAGFLIFIGVLVALIPSNLERRLAPFVRGERGRSIAGTLARVPATLGEGFRFALGLFAHPSRGGLAVIGAAGFWAANIGILWASFHALASACHSPWSSRASSLAWSPTSSRLPRRGWARSTRG